MLCHEENCFPHFLVWRRRFPELAGLVDEKDDWSLQAKGEERYQAATFPVLFDQSSSDQTQFPDIDRGIEEIVATSSQRAHQRLRGQTRRWSHKQRRDWSDDWSYQADRAAFVFEHRRFLDEPMDFPHWWLRHDARRSNFWSFNDSRKKQSDGDLGVGQTNKNEHVENAIKIN